MRKSFFHFLLITIVFVQSAFALDLKCSKAVTSLSSRQLDVLSEALESRGFSVSVLEKEIKGKTKTIVVLGEEHLKSKTQSEIGIQLLKEFSHYGLEGADPTKTWGGKLFRASLALQYALNRMISPKKMGSGSTILDAENIVIDQYDKSRAAQVAEEIANRLQLRERSRNELMVLEIDWFGKELNGLEFLEYLLILKSDARYAIEEAGGKKQRIRLEEGHKPDLAENISSVSIPAVFAGMLILFGKISFNFGSFAMTSNVEVLLEGLIIASAAYAIATIASATKHKWIHSQTVNRNPFLRGFLNPKLGLLKARDRTMASNSHSFFESENSPDILLNIVGRSHVAGINKILIRDYGYTLVVHEIENESL